MIRTWSRLGVLTGLLVVAFAAQAQAHCELPCGIYGDQMRIRMMEEDLVTVEKSMRLIKELQGAEEINYNQLVRWVTNKESHANKIQEVVSQYFLTQRIKEKDQDYDKKLQLLHQMLVSAMRCKQTTDQEHVDDLRKLIHDFETLYFKDAD